MCSRSANLVSVVNHSPGDFLGGDMDLCDALREYGTGMDYAAWGLMCVLGIWKMIELGERFFKWIQAH